jgi:hypothetical protein
MTSSRRFVASALLTLVVSTPAFAVDCVNKYLSRTEGGTRQVVTLLTGKLTFQEAQDLSKAINAKTAPPFEWIDEKGRTISRQMGELKVVRPMPVGCDGKTSGVVVIATFPTLSQPIGKMVVKINPDTLVTFEQQKQ